MIILLVPLNANALTVETLEQWMSEIDVGGMTLIKDKNQPQASAYITIRNSNGDLVGVNYVTATEYLEHPLFYHLLNERNVSKNVTLEGTQYQMLDLVTTSEFIDADCNNAAQRITGYGTINDVCFFYSFGSDFSARLGVIDPENVAVDGYNVSLFHGLHHGFIVEEGDTISMVWTTLIPIN
tara:strand:+ start:140 stop:685 length:546 start_codon:yes stop_codon:yes gene_type:complete